jgi:hypothetical protein
MLCAKTRGSDMAEQLSDFTNDFVAFRRQRSVRGAIEKNDPGHGTARSHSPVMLNT